MKVMLLAAGRGERMRPLTDTTPKPLLEAGGKTLAGRLIERLAAEGFRNLVINLAHLGEMIAARFGDGRALGVNIRYSHEHAALETAGGIAAALPLLGDPFLAVNADLHTDYPFNALEGVLRGDAIAHLVFVDNPPHHPDGRFFPGERSGCERRATRCSRSAASACIARGSSPAFRRARADSWRRSCASRPRLDALLASIFVAAGTTSAPPNVSPRSMPELKGVPD